MGRPTQGYYLEGVRVPGTTTIISRFKESGALIHWAARMAGQYVADNLPVGDTIPRATVLELCDQATNNYRNVRDAAADAGTLAHDLVEAWVKGDAHQPLLDDVPDADVRQSALNAFQAFEAWRDNTGLELVWGEKPLVSAAHRFGGTPDAVFRDRQGRFCLGDWKTSKGVYPDMMLQLAAYELLIEECAPDSAPLAGGFHLLRFDKGKRTAFAHYYWASMERERDAFLLMRDLYDMMKEIKA